jgi:hypothetical protein
MKRKRNGSQGAQIEVAPATYNYFPLPFLVRLEHYVDDATISAMSRCSKRHMILCYTRISRLLLWNTPKVMRETLHYGHDFFPADAFLQMQIAKTVFSTPQDDRTPKSAEAPANAIDQLVTGRNKELWPFSFESYLRSICFKDASIIIKTVGPNVNKKNDMEFQALHILYHDTDAKARLYMQLGNYDAYLRYRRGVYKTCYFRLSLDVCSSENADPRFVIKEAELAIANGYNGINDIYDYLGTDSTWERDFLAVEHKEVFDYLQSNDLMEMHWMSYDLLTNPNRGIQRCERLMRLDCFNNEEFFDTLQQAYDSLLGYDFDAENEEHVANYLNDYGEEILFNELTALITYKGTRRETGWQIERMLPHLKHRVNQDTFIELQGLLQKQ